MLSTVTRSFLAAILMAALVVTVLPQGFAQTQSARPRRGKNGEVINKGGSTPATSRETQAGTPNSRPPADDPRQAEDMANPDSIDRQPATVLNSRQSNTNTSQQTGGTRRRKEPPPFDRPPLDASTSSPTGTASAEPPPPPRRPYPSTTDRNPTPRTSNDDSRDAERGDRQPPVLRRTPEHDPGPAQPRDTDMERTRNKPTLRRPSDPPADADDRDTRQNDPPRRSERPGAGPQPASDADDVIKLDATLVNIPVLVSDRSGRYVPQLTERDFLIYEDGAQQEVAFFGNERVPFNVALLLDVSPSVQGSLQEIQNAAIAFVRQMRPEDRIMVASFDRNIYYHTDFTNNRRVLESAIYSTDTGSGTSVYEAVYDVVARRLRHIEGRKALIILSDGEDTTSSKVSYDDAIDIVTESDVLVYALRYSSSGITVQTGPRVNIPNIPFPLPFPWPWPMPRRRRGGNFTNNLANNAANAAQWPRRGGHRDFLEDLATAGGGPVYDADRISDLTRLATRVAEELRHVYVISYYPTNSLTNGGYRQIRIRVRGRDDIAVRHRRGYNARDMGTRTGT